VEKINKINTVVDRFFEENPAIDKIAAKELMPHFMDAGIYINNHRDGLPLRNDLREWKKANKLHFLPSILAETKNKNTKWFFTRKNVLVPRYWVGAYYYGTNDDIDQFDVFMQEGWWGTDHQKESKKGAVIYRRIEQIEVGDKLALRSFDKKNSLIKIRSIGTITDVSEKTNGWVSVKWEQRSSFYSGAKPAGESSGAFWDTVTEITRKKDIELLFGSPVILEKIARICWNEHGWVKPSGWKGKSDAEGTHEAGNGYGHEEWLLDLDKIYKGYHYGFLQPINQNKELYADKTFNVSLYTIDGTTNKKYWIGTIKNVSVIDENETQDVLKFYKLQGWINEMQNQLSEVTVEHETFKKWHNDLFNLKFLPVDLDLLPEPLEIANFKESIGTPRYILVNKKIEPEFEHKNDGAFEFKAQKPGDNGNYASTYNSIAKTVELSFTHKRIVDGLYKKLCGIHGKTKVGCELPTGFGTRIDIAVDSKDGLIIYEIKTYNSLRENVREAIGQILEYCYWPDRDLAKELIIVSHLEVTDEVKVYLASLRKKYKLPIYYQSYEIETSKLSEKF
jgi:hypothetical protein